MRNFFGLRWALAALIAAGCGVPGQDEDAAWDEVTQEAKGGGGGGGSPTFTFDSTTGLLTVTGSESADGITVGRSADSIVLLNGRKIRLKTGELGVALVTSIKLSGLGGDDSLGLDESVGALPPASIEGGAGNDAAVFVGASAGEVFSVAGSAAGVQIARAGNAEVDATLVERVRVAAAGGADTLSVLDLTGTGVTEVAVDLGTPGNGAGDGAADSVMIWGTNNNDSVTIADAGGAQSVTGLSATVVLEAAESADQLWVVTGYGDDSVNASAMGDLSLFLVGGTGIDALTGSAHDDTFVWDPGGSSDVIEGGAGQDTLTFNASNAGEMIDLAANGQRLSLTRSIGTVAMDIGGVEQVDLFAKGSADTIAIHDLTNSGVTGVAIDLSAYGLPGGDGAVDTVSIEGTSGNDQIAVSDPGGVETVTGLSAVVTVVAIGSEDAVWVRGMLGDDVIDASASTAMGMRLFGDYGDDVLTGGAGPDMVHGGLGADVVKLGPGDDTFVWDPGNASDTVDGEGGYDTLDFQASNAGEAIDVSAIGQRVRMTRSIGNVVMDLGTFERVSIAAKGGSDTISIHDLSGTGVTKVPIDLSASGAPGTGDGALDVVTVEGTTGDDVLYVTGDASAVGVQMASFGVTLLAPDAALGDYLRVNALSGDDVIDASSLGAIMTLTLDVGAGNDVVLGSAGGDLILGGDGDDVLLGGPGWDLIDGGLGNNVIIQD